MTGVRTRALASVLVASVVALMPGPASALDATQCEAAFEHGQELALDAKLSVARATFAVCTDASCPSLVRAECARRVEAMSTRMPSIVPAARDANGRDLVDVAVDLDGQPVATSLAGKAVDVDPGPHRLRFRWREHERTLDVVVREGEKLRAIDVRFDEPASLPVSRAPRSTPASVYVLGSLSLVALGTGAVVGATALSDNGTLHDQCAPACSASAEDSVRNRFIVADVALGLGVAAAIAAVWIYFSAPPRAPSVATVGAFRF